jgi:hypothetical protein
MEHYHYSAFGLLNKHLQCLFDELGVTRDSDEKFDVIIFCHSMYGLNPKAKFIEQALQVPSRWNTTTIPLLGCSTSICSACSMNLALGFKP